MEPIDNGMVERYRCCGLFALCLVCWTSLLSAICTNMIQWLESPGTTIWQNIHIFVEPERTRPIGPSLFAVEAVPTGPATMNRLLQSTTQEQPVVDPTDNVTAFNYHDSFSKREHDIKAARSPLFDTWVSANLLSTDSTITSSSPATPTSTLLTTSTLPPSISASSTRLIPAHSTPPIPASCPGVPSAKYEGVVASGWRATKVKGGMGAARGVIFDTAGNILVVESGKGITAHTVGSDGCITSSKTIIPQRSVSHGIALDANGTTLYASSMTSVWSWTYDSKTSAVVGGSKMIISGMSNSGHPSRTLVIPPNHPNLLIVSHGSGDNLDCHSGDMKTQRAVIKVFDMSVIPTAGYKFVTDGHQAGYGLRNEVGLAFDGNKMSVKSILSSDII